MHYLIQGIFVLTGMIAFLAALFNWNWFFTAQNAQYIVKNTGRKKARFIYAILGIVMIACGIFFFLSVQEYI